MDPVKSVSAARWEGVSHLGLSEKVVLFQTPCLQVCVQCTLTGMSGACWLPMDDS